MDATKYLYERKYVTNKQQFLATFPWQYFSLTLPWLLVKIPDISLPAVKIREISRFYRQVVSMYYGLYVYNRRRNSSNCNCINEKYNNSIIYIK